MNRGGVVRYRGLDAYFRYEGVGSIEIKIDDDIRAISALLE
jgi:hypothetical protein